MVSIGIFYFGCKVNQYDLARISTALQEANINVTTDHVGDINIVAGCVVTHKAEREGIKLIKKIKRKHPDSLVFLMGCLAVHRGEDLKKDGLVDDFFVTTEDDIKRLTNKLSIIVGKKIKLPSKVNLLDHSRAFLKIQDGCTYQCSFCLSRQTRISVISYDVDKKIEELRKLLLSGVTEVVITGINVMIWTDGIHDISYLLLKLADEAHKFGGRIRISSVYPDKKLFKFIPLWQHPAVANHLHLSVQSGSPKVLKSMNRVNYIPLLDEYLVQVREIDRGFGLTGDFIVGFPTENDADFKLTIEFVKRHVFNKLHVFPYSPRRGTQAFDLKPLPSALLKHRSAVLRSIGEELKQAFVAEHNGSVRPAIYLWNGRVLFDNYLYMRYSQPFTGIKQLEIDSSKVL